MADIQFSEFTPITDETPGTQLVGFDGLSNIRGTPNVFRKIRTVLKTISYVILDNDFYERIEVDTTAGDVTITLPVRANNRGRPIEIAHIKGAYKIIIKADATEAKLSNDGLTEMWLPKIGNIIAFKESVNSGFWEVINQKITSQLTLDTYAGFGSTDNKIMRFTNVTENVGNMFSENHSTGYSANAKGLEITINRSGLYSLLGHGGDQATGKGIGFTVDSATLTKDIMDADFNLTTRINYVMSATDSSALPCTITKKLVKGNVVRFHTSGSAPTTASRAMVTVTFLG